MSHDQLFAAISLPAGDDLTAKQYRFGKLNSSGAIVPCGVAGESAIGVIYTPGKADEAVMVAVSGLLRVVAGGSVAIAASVATDNQGRAVTASGDALVLGKALTAASGAGQVITVLVK